MIPDSLFIQMVKTVTARYPAVVPHLKGRARWVAADGHWQGDFWHVFKESFIYSDGLWYRNTSEGWKAEGWKTVDFFRRNVIRLIRGLYNRDIDRGQFLDIMANLIQGQLSQAFYNGMMDAGLSQDEITDTMQKKLESLILAQYPYVDRLAADVINARELEQPVDPLTARADLWANRWNEAFNAGKLAVGAEFGLKMAWVLGPTEHCETCQACAGVVAFASEWELAGLRPQGSNLICGGFRCQCELIPTDRRRSPKAWERLMGVPRG